MAMNLMDSFRPTVGVHVYDHLNDRWHTLDDAMVRDMERWAAEQPANGYQNWNGLLLLGWLRADTSLRVPTARRHIPPLRPRMVEPGPAPIPVNSRTSRQG